MKTSTLGFASLVLGSLVVASVASAEEPIKPPSPPLTAARKLDSVNRALKSLGTHVTSLPPAQMKVTPMATKDPGGARIAYAAPIGFVGSSSVAPDGMFTLIPFPNAKAEVRLEFPTEKDKLHVVDCRALVTTLSGPAPMTINRGSTTTVVNPEDGHYLYVFKSDAVNQTVKMWLDTGIIFYGCEITKVP